MCKCLVYGLGAALTRSMDRRRHRVIPIYMHPKLFFCWSYKDGMSNTGQENIRASNYTGSYPAL